MGKRLKQAAVVFLVILVAAQFIRPERSNPPTDMNRTIQAHMGTRPDWSPSWIARAATVIRTRPCGRGTRKSRPCRG